MNSIITATASTTAIATYTGSSCSHRFLRSVTIADIPDTKHWLLVMLLISFIASIVSSADVDVSKNTAIIVEWSVLNIL